MELDFQNESALQAFGARLGALLEGGELLELRGDVGAGKTTLTKAIASGMGVSGDVSSPSYALSQTYNAAHGRRLVHYDFYRLDDAGVMANELVEVMTDPRAVIVIEWAGIVDAILPKDHLTISIVPTSEEARRVRIEATGPRSGALVEKLA